MRPKASTIFRAILTAILAVGVVLSANSRMVTHDSTALAQIVAEHLAEIEDHGHAHEDIADLMHANNWHSHDVLDHDHNIAFVPPVPGTQVELATSETWILAFYTMPDRRDFGLDRPPRV